MPRIWAQGKKTQSASNKTITSQITSTVYIYTCNNSRFLIVCIPIYTRSDCRISNLHKTDMEIKIRCNQFFQESNHRYISKGMICIWNVRCLFTFPARVYPFLVCSLRDLKDRLSSVFEAYIARSDNYASTLFCVGI